MFICLLVGLVVLFSVRKIMCPESKFRKVRTYNLPDFFIGLCPIKIIVFPDVNDKVLTKQMLIVSYLRHTKYRVCG